MLESFSLAYCSKHLWSCVQRHYQHNFLGMCMSFCSVLLLLTKTTLPPPCQNCSLFTFTPDRPLPPMHTCKHTNPVSSSRHYELPVLWPALPCCFYTVLNVTYKRFKKGLVQLCVFINRLINWIFICGLKEE